MSTDRVALLGDRLTASFNAKIFGGRIEPAIASLIAVGRTTPYAALQSQSCSTPDYSETDVSGGGFGLNYIRASRTDTRTEFGARFDGLPMLYGIAVLSLRARARLGP